MLGRRSRTIYVDRQKASLERSIEGEKALLSAYTSTYNNLDTLCWSIPTRVLAGNLAVLTFISIHRPTDVTDFLLLILSLLVLSLINKLGASALHKLWLDHTRMGYWIAVLEEDLAPPAASRTGLKHYQGASSPPTTSGYFTDRHETNVGFDEWAGSKHATATLSGYLRSLRRARGSKRVKRGARASNVVFMQAASAALAVIAGLSLIALVIGVLQGDPLGRLRFLVKEQTSSLGIVRCVRRPGSVTSSAVCR